ncbi:MAG: Mrp/NBP35 family ATP-binding protein [Clostridium sp.]|uniref:Mrp/NBP35 family ATP-binding protein n=1 Tax=Clostridium sp. TaxID=1506 RepID=UPI0025C203DC|nr:Mrp/NBP35 family ATP-binding protein [Clostridium sp.]MCH3965957.1 Mrp/NBP35 family ATP-binding protein [Clostridium sp.]MCI1715954.1 Mrp/NBP35 family ATP-binding protein [Clostridium sp.]MCI1800374.1 Mrp/NBP35 family ATP-binding protein [Clostridium sp.]MCI1814131.1 Mrp/NBP35 family ATP-binding protein [Clostridium sp.]MCI1871030.1 Mrp/NBP35 family ATP-binding protein [Clostridium sp.]
MSNCNSCPSNDGCEKDKESCMIKNNPMNNVKKVIGVMSGKGGVGKSTISVLLAKELNKKGFKVGILDADITGPSIPKLLNLKNKRAESIKRNIVPVTTKEGIKVISLNLLIENEEEPVIWRGPIIGSVVEQFWTDVLWGELDYLVIDMPPGTGDVAITVMQSIPIDGIIMVSVSQDLVSMIVSKAVNMVKKMDIKILGIIENMSYVKCPNCNKKIKIFNGENTYEFLEKMNLKLLGELPVVDGICNSLPSKNKNTDNSIGSIFSQIVENIIKSLEKEIKDEKSIGISQGRI